MPKAQHLMPLSVTHKLKMLQESVENNNVEIPNNKESTRNKTFENIFKPNELKKPSSEPNSGTTMFKTSMVSQNLQLPAYQNVSSKA
ncbi:hypothetical protein M8J77_011691 [Diaphorina citri]|nr:hypothetical protein M8J77_011691 [Diaphorina citri]